MGRRNQTENARKDDGATVGYEVQLWQMAEALLPGLISSELRVKDDERFVEGVA
jgi:hypothetical protein